MLEPEWRSKTEDRTCSFNPQNRLRQYSLDIIQATLWDARLNSMEVCRFDIIYMGQLR